MDCSKTVLFDAYGTIIDVGIYHRDITHFVLEKYGGNGVTINPEEFNSCWNKEFELAFSDIHAYCGNFLNVREIYGISTKNVFKRYGVNLTERETKALNDVYKQMLDQTVTIIPSVKKTVETLHSSGFSLGMVSNGDTDELLQHLNGVRDYFDVIITSEDLKIYKPDPRIFTEAVRQIGAVKERTLFTGDTLTSDVLGAKKAGLTSIWYNKRRRMPKYGITPDFEIFDMTEVLQILRS